MTELTVEVWFKPKQLASEKGEDMHIVNKAHGGVPWNSYVIFIEDDDDTIKFTVKNSSGDSATATSGVTASLNKWYHVVGTFNSTHIKIYINGTLKDTSAGPKGTVFDSNYSLRIGANEVTIERFR